MKFIHESSQGMSYSIYMPPRKYQELLISVAEIRGIPNFEFERIIPTNEADLLINLGQKLIGKFKNGRVNLKQGSCVIRGTQFGYYDSILPEKTHFLSVKLTNKGVDLLMKMPPAALTNTLEEISLKTCFYETIMRIIDARSFEHRVALVTAWIQSKHQNDRGNVLADFVEKKIIEDPSLTAYQLEKASGYTAKYLNQLFKNYTGHTISNFKRLCRFNNVLNSLKFMEDSVWADVVHVHNFYDQSHFIKEVKHFTGLSPSQIRENFSNKHYNLIF